ncbi:MAG: molybdopterin molybdotransferase MoeA [Clostridia bacterium]|nr:molybdopterin molybdotransferase MoeA [Clostridia bacterium]
MLNVVSLNEAVGIARTRMPAPSLAAEELPLDAAAGRTLSEDIVSGENVPAFARSTMDGFAVRAADTFGATAALPSMLRVAGEIKMGEETSLSIVPGECAAIPTGGMLPKGADAVIPVEYTETQGDLCLCCAAVSPLRNVTRAGDDVARGQVVLKAGTRLTPASVGVLAAMGRGTVPVFRRPKIGILSTGNEIIAIEKKPLPGQIRDVNSHLLLSLCAVYGCEGTAYGVAPDEKNALLAALREAAAENDAVLLSGGSSAGKADLTAEAIDELGEVYCHGIAVKPGKPTVLGQVCGKAVFGLPGHPAACWFMAELLIKEYVHRLLRDETAPVPVKASLTEHVSSNHGREELLCVRLDGAAAVPVYGKSGVISQLAAADGYIVIPRDCEGLRAGEPVDVYLF